MNQLTERQQLVLDFICASIRERGYPPTLREIGLKLGIRSTNGVNDHLRALERKGYLTREDMKSRTLRPTEPGPRRPVDEHEGAPPVGFGVSATSGSGGGKALQERLVRDDGVGSLRAASGARDVGRGRDADAASDDMIEVPVLGRVAAGALATAIQSATDSVRIDRMLLGVGGRSKGGDVFGLRIHGESMIEAGIHHGDYVFVRKSFEAPRGAVVIAMVGDEATCKYYFPEATHIRLQPANAAMAPILVPRNDWRETQILGVVVGVYRKL